MSDLSNAKLECIEFRLQLLPPSVNHYIRHKGRNHRKSPEAMAWVNSFMAMLPASLRGCYVQGDVFSVSLEIFPGPDQRGDVDNYLKLPLDCIAQAGMLRDPKGNECSDAKIKTLHVYVLDSPEDRARGPEMRFQIRAQIRKKALM
jgi:Holliday junction resolvase RusA-like endonuclease